MWLPTTAKGETQHLTTAIGEMWHLTKAKGMMWGLTKVSVYMTLQTLAKVMTWGMWPGNET